MRRAAWGVPCPACGAGEGQPCWTVKTSGKQLREGQPRWAVHAERLHAWKYHVETDAVRERPIPDD